MMLVFSFKKCFSVVLVLVLVLVLVFILLSDAVMIKGGALSNSKRKKCFQGDGDDTNGKWYNTTSVSTAQLTSAFTDLHAEGNATMEMLQQYKRLWLPHECTTFRYTKALAEKYLAKLAEKERRRTINVAFFGDSALRGLYCSIGRIFAGSETDGENINDVCGGKHIDGNWRKVKVPISLADKGKVTAGVALQPFFNSTFTYTTTFDASLFFKAKQLMAKHNDLYALVIATGAWDFHSPMHEHLKKLDKQDFEYPYVNATAECLDDNYHAASKERNSVYIKDFFVPELSKLAKANDVRLMYRNNHYNARFGVKCADEEFEASLRFPGSVWEIIDSRNQTQEHWRDQTFDGYHFDRSKVYRAADSSYSFISKQWHLFHNKQIRHEHMVELEGQLAQSFLNRLLRDVA